uniref:Uncharacterized protein n=1 Tax=Megaselia scalaris TaxID=36166 RepID=T1GS87_MEGSC
MPSKSLVPTNAVSCLIDQKPIRYSSYGQFSKKPMSSKLNTTNYFRLNSSFIIKPIY